MENVAVDCVFSADGVVQVRRIHLNGRWHPVEQGRQWQDAHGRSVLIMMPTGKTHKLLLHAGSLQWQLHTRTTGQIVV